MAQEAASADATPSPSPIGAMVGMACEATSTGATPLPFSRQCHDGDDPRGCKRRCHPLPFSRWCHGGDGLGGHKHQCHPLPFSHRCHGGDGAGGALRTPESSPLQRKHRVLVVLLLSSEKGQRLAGGDPDGQAMLATGDTPVGRRRPSAHRIRLRHMDLLLHRDRPHLDLLLHCGQPRAKGVAKNAARSRGWFRAHLDFVRPRAEDATIAADA